MQFKLVTQEPLGARVKINFIQCASCNTPVGVTDFFDASSQLALQTQALAKRFDNLEHQLNNITRLLQQRR